jgi:hypothetical protein
MGFSNKSAMVIILDCAVSRDWGQNVLTHRGGEQEKPRTLLDRHWAMTRNTERVLSLVSVREQAIPLLVHFSSGPGLSMARRAVTARFPQRIQGISTRRQAATASRID